MSKMYGDTKDFKRVLTKFKKLEKEMPNFCVAMSAELSNRILREARLNTPEISGELRRGYFVTPVRREGNNYPTEVKNDTYYASWEENGHRQEVGRYVPELGRRLKKPWVSGSFRLLKATRKIEKIAPRIIEKRIKVFFGE